MSVLKTFFTATLMVLVLLVGLGIWSYYDSDKFNVQEARVTLTSVKKRLASIFHIPTASTKPVPILMYHYVRDNVDQEADPLGYALSVPPSEFRAQLALLKKEGWQTVSLAEVAKGNYDDKSVVLTFDDGYKDFILEAYPLLRQFNFKATVFMIADKVDNPAHLSTDDVVFLANQGFEIGSHSVTHSNLATQSHDELINELADSKRLLENITDREVIILSYPAGQYNDLVETAAEQTGYQLAVTTESGIAVPNDGPFRLTRLRVRRGLSDQAFRSLLTP